MSRSQEFTVHALSSSQSNNGVPTHNPDVHWSFTVHWLSSSQVVLSMGWLIHPNVSLQKSSVHELLSSQLTVPPTQRPCAQNPAALHADIFSQEVPSGFATTVHAPDSGKHTATVHGVVCSTLQSDTDFGSAMHSPATHAGLPLHLSPSSKLTQSVSDAQLGQGPSKPSQRPSLQTSFVVHGFPSSHC